MTSTRGPKKKPILRSGDGVYPVGAPPDGEARDPMRVISFKAGDDVQDALDVLVGRLGPEVRAKRSIAIRRAILRDAEARG